MNTYTNPLTKDTCPDPYVLEFQGTYYCYATDVAGVRLFRSDDLVHWEGPTFAYQSSREHDYWAPSVIRIGATFYLYYSSVREGQQEECLKVATSATPEGPFVFQKQLFPWFSIDSQPVLWEGRLFLFYSTNTETGTLPSRPGTAILVDLMDTPLSVNGHPRLVLRPTMDEEIFARNRFGDGRDWHTIEGASFLAMGNRLVLMYSANAYIHEDYYIGLATGEARHDLREVAWKKYPDDHTRHALLKRTDQVEGTGHNSVAKGPDLLEDWIIYHGRDCAIPLDLSTEQRVMRIDRIHQNGEIIVCGGPTHTPQPVPASPDLLQKHVSLHDDRLTCIPKGVATAEVWMRPEPSHMGATYGLWMGNRRLSTTVGVDHLTLSVTEGNIRRTEAVIPLPQTFDHTTVHQWRVTRAFGWWTVQLDGVDVLKDALLGEENGGVFASCSTVTLIDLRMTRGVVLEGQRLAALGSLCAITPTLPSTGEEILVAETATLTSFTSPASYQLTLFPAAGDATFQLWNKTQMVRSIALDATGRTIGIMVDADGIHLDGQTGASVRLTHLFLQRCLCKFLK